MAKSLRVAVKQYHVQKDVLEALEMMFPAETIAKWRAALCTWEDDFGESPNPFHEEHESISLSNLLAQSLVDTIQVLLQRMFV